MVESCPVCHEPTVGSAKHCPKCGFPSVLAGRLEGPLPLPETPGEEVREEPAPRNPQHEASASPEAEVNAVLARSLQERMELLRAIDRDPPDLTGALCEAALNEGSGRVADAQQVLRSAQEHLDSETEELLAAHLSSLEARGQTLAATGLRVALEDELGRLAETIVAGDAAASVAALLASERRLDGLEAHWRGLQGLLAEVATLREEAAGLGIDLGGVPDRLETVRAGLATMPADEHDLDVAAQAAAETLMALHQAIPAALEQELAQHAGRLEAHPRRSSRLHSARRLHREAVDHLKSGRLADAVRSVRELRGALDELAKEVVAPPVEPAPPAPSVEAAPPAAPQPRVAPKVSVRPGAVPTAEATAAGPRPPVAPTGGGPSAPPDLSMLSVLTKKARSLAVRVRSLPPDSEAAASAARQIHEATELLRAGLYADADAALARLMRSLAASESKG